MAFAVVNGTAVELFRQRRRPKKTHRVSERGSIPSVRALHNPKTEQSEQRYDVALLAHPRPLLASGSDRRRCSRAVSGRVIATLTVYCTSKQIIIRCQPSNPNFAPFFYFYFLQVQRKLTLRPCRSSLKKVPITVIDAPLCHLYQLFGESRELCRLFVLLAHLGCLQSALLCQSMSSSRKR